MALQAFQSCFNVADDHCDVLLHLHINNLATLGKTASDLALDSKGQAKRTAKRKLEQTGGDALNAATYSLHAVVLSVASAYFKARLSNTWQGLDSSGSTGPSGVSTRPASIRYELVEHVEADEVEAMEQVLRLMYGFSLPEDSGSQHLFHCLRLADRLEAVQCMETLLGQLTDVVKDAKKTPNWVSTLHTPIAKFATQIFSMPPGAACLPAATLLEDAGRDLLKRLYGNIPAVINSQQLRRDFCSLPLPAVLAWAELNELEVHSENCVACLLTAWVAEQPTGAVSPEQLEQLAHQVRVLQLGQTYMYHILPNLPWFKGCSSMQHLPSLLTRKGMVSARQWVFPKPGLGGAVDWQGAPQWVAAPRKRCRTGAIGRLTWRVHAAELHQLYATRSVCSPEHLVVNGIPLVLSMKAYEGDALQPGKSVGLYCAVSKDASLGYLGLPWSDAAVVTVDHCICKVIGPAATSSDEEDQEREQEVEEDEDDDGEVEDDNDDDDDEDEDDEDEDEDEDAEEEEVEETFTQFALQGFTGIGDAWRFCKPSAPAATFEQLMAPYLKDGQLHLEATFKLEDTFSI